MNTLAPSPKPATTSPEGSAHPAPHRILSLSCVYPNPSEPEHGLFVRARLQHLGTLAEVKVLAPIAAVDYAKARAWLFGRRGIPFRRKDGNTEVMHPLWVYPPGGGCLNPLLLFLRLLPLAIRLRRQFPFEVLDAHFAYPDGIAGCLLAGALGVPLAITMRGNETMHAQHRLRRLMMTWALRRAERLITVSERLRGFALSSGVEPGRVKTISNGVDRCLFRPRDRGECRRKHGIDPRAAIILSAGALIERKGHHRVVRALSGLVQQHAGCQLLIAGGQGREGQFANEIRRLVSELRLDSAVRFTGQVTPEEMAELMCAADVLCLASTREGWPNVVHEAMACGLPVVANDVGAVPEMIPSPEYGFIVPAADGGALQQALSEALRKAWNRKAISAWAQSRSWEAVAREVMDEMQHMSVK